MAVFFAGHAIAQHFTTHRRHHHHDNDDDAAEDAAALDDAGDFDELADDPGTASTAATADAGATASAAGKAEKPGSATPAVGLSKRRKDSVLDKGVKQSIYVKYLQQELDKETACMELPFTIVLLVAFAVFAMCYVSQETMTIVEEAMVSDITENANFAWAHNFGHKGIHDINSFADFWSWTRLGFVPLVAPSAPWFYSESLQEVMDSVAPGYDVSALPTRQPFPGHRKQVPVKNDYLRYNRIIGGFRFRQQVATPDSGACIFPGDRGLFSRWFGKPCTELIDWELPPDLDAAEAMENPARTEWFMSEVEDHKMLIQRTIDMEDGCASATKQNRTCLCRWCALQAPMHPWLNELTIRIEISFVAYNAQYGVYCMASANLWFNRAGQIHKLVSARSSWAGLGVRDAGDLTMIVLSGVTWIVCCLFVIGTEVIEIIELIRSKNKPWHFVLADDYIGFWNCVDWISIGFACMILGYFVALWFAIQSVNGVLGDVASEAAAGNARSGLAFEDQVVDFYLKVESMMATEYFLRFMMCIYPLVLMMRLFKSFAAQPRLAVVTNTFKEARDDLGHFFIVFFSVYFCMAVNAVLFFGQDSLSFATIDRAMHSCFRAMLGDWGWEEMREIGHVKAFVWFFLFMVVMVLVLLNMLLAILMEAYGAVKDDAQGAPSLPQQIFTMYRRSQMNKTGERVKLTQILEGLLEDDSFDEDKMMSNERALLPDHESHYDPEVITALFPEKPGFLMDIVAGIPKSQALRTLTASQADFDRKEEEKDPFTAQDLQENLLLTMDRVDNMLTSSAWLAWKLREYKNMEEEEEEELERSAIVPAERTQAAAAKSQEEQLAEIEAGVQAVKDTVFEHTAELADGIASVLGEEMQRLERREGDMRDSMEQMQNALDSLRQLVYKLTQTCEEVGAVASRLSSPDHIEITPEEATAVAAARANPRQSGTSRARTSARNQPLHNHRFSTAVGGSRAIEDNRT